MDVLRTIEKALKYPTAALCAYEAVAILTGWVPAITIVTARHRWLAPVIAGLTAWHLLAWPTA